jgi:hypothetical protein
MTIGPRWKPPSNGRRLQLDGTQVVREVLQRKRGVREKKNKIIECTIGKLCPKLQKPAEGANLWPETAQTMKELKKQEKVERKKKALEGLFTKAVIIGVALSSSLTFAGFHRSGGEVMSNFFKFGLGHEGRSYDAKPSSSSNHGQGTSSNGSILKGIFSWA